MKIELNYQNSVIALPGAVIDKLPTASEQDLKVLLTVAADLAAARQIDAAKLAVRLEIPEREAENALSFWRGAGILKTSRSVKEKKEEPAQPEETAAEGREIPLRDGLPCYTGKEIEKIMGERKRLGQLLEECQKILDRVFNVSESNLCIALSDLMHLDDDYVLLLCSYCVNKQEKGVTMRYVYNTAARLYEDGILSVQQLEDYIAANEERRGFENHMRRLFGIGGRKLTAKETRVFDAWRGFSFPLEVYTFAYECAVDATGDASVPYINKILTAWKNAGVKDLEGAKAESARHREEYEKLLPARTGKTAGGKKKEDFTSFDPNEFFTKAVNRSLDGEKGKGENS